jgi:hypothetical protein
MSSATWSGCVATVIGLVHAAVLEAHASMTLAELWRAARRQR